MSAFGSSDVKSTQREARVAGLLYLALALTAPIGLIYVPSKIIVSGDAAATADHLRASGWLLRVGVGSELAHQVVMVFLALALYRLFRAVDAWRSAQLVILGALVSVPIVFVNVLNELAALMLVGDLDFLARIPPHERDALAYFFLRLHGEGITVASVFWGLWLFPFGSLVIKSEFIPQAFGWLLVGAGAGYLADSFTSLVVPRYEDVVSLLARPLEMGELPIVLWLVIWGVRRPRAAAGHASAA